MMPKAHYLPTDDSGRANFLDHFAAQLARHAETLEIQAAVVAATQSDAGGFRHALRMQQQMQAYAQECTVYKNQMRDGGVATNQMPVAPTLPTPIPPPVAPGVLPRLTALVARIKTHPAYSDAIGAALGIIGAEQVDDPANWKPLIGVDIQAGHPVVQWTKGGADALELWVDRGDGKGFVFLEVDSRPPCPDPSPLPAAGSSAVWKYRAIYRLRDERIGQWSDVTSVAVGG